MNVWSTVRVVVAGENQSTQRRTCPRLYDVFGEQMNVWSTGGVVVAGENQSSQRKTCPSASLSITNPNGLGWYQTQASSLRG
jgi:hypothetical protein